MVIFLHLALDNFIQSLLKISLIWCNKLNYNYKYIYINETGFINNKKKINRCGGIVW